MSIFLSQFFLQSVASAIKVSIAQNNKQSLCPRRTSVIARSWTDEVTTTGVKLASGTGRGTAMESGALVLILVQVICVVIISRKHPASGKMLQRLNSSSEQGLLMN